MAVSSTSFDVPTGCPAAPPVCPLPSVPGWRHALRRGRPGIGPEHIKGEHRDPAASPGREAIVFHGTGRRFGGKFVPDNIGSGIATGVVVVPQGANGACQQA